MNKVASHRRHDMSDEACKILELHLSNLKGSNGRPAYDNLNFINAVFGY